MNPHVAHRVLQLAEQHNFVVMEDDIFCDLQVHAQRPRLATLDQLQRVIYVRSFSKTLSGSLRVGFVACAPRPRQPACRHQDANQHHEAQFTERLIYQMLIDGHYRKYLSRLRDRLADARTNVLRAFERIGLELFAEPAGGMFVWARLPGVEELVPLAQAAQRDRILLAPGTVFRPHLGTSPWMRFNIAACEDTRVLRWLHHRTTNAISI